jgi:hypothetical protein
LRAKNDDRVVWVLLIILSGLMVSSYLIISYHEFSFFCWLYCNYWPDRLQIVYVAANQTSREIFCKVRNTGNGNSSLVEIRVNSSEVSMVSQLPMNIGSTLDYRTCVFRYEGPWKGSILIDFYTVSGGQYERWGKLVDLQTASSDHIEGAYPSGAELLARSFYLRFGHYFAGLLAQWIYLGFDPDNMEFVLWGSIAIFVALAILLIVRHLNR